MSDVTSTNPEFCVDAAGARAVFTYGDVTIQVSFPASDGLADLPPEEQQRRAAPQLRRALSVALEDLG